MTREWSAQGTQVHFTSQTPGAQTSPYSSGWVSPRRIGGWAGGNQVAPGKVRKQPWAALCPWGPWRTWLSKAALLGPFMRVKETRSATGKWGNSFRGPASPTGQLSAQRQGLKRCHGSPRKDSLIEQISILGRWVVSYDIRTSFSNSNDEGNINKSYYLWNKRQFTCVKKAISTQ